MLANQIQYYKNIALEFRFFNSQEFSLQTIVNLQYFEGKHCTNRGALTSYTRLDQYNQPVVYFVLFLILDPILQFLLAGLQEPKLASVAANSVQCISTTCKGKSTTLIFLSISYETLHSIFWVV